VSDLSESSHAFYAATLRFVALRSERHDDRVTAMMVVLDDIAGQLERGDAFTIRAGDLRLAARALAGVAGFLQQHILPEAVAAGNAAGETQIRWVIDRSMECVSELTTHAELTADGEDRTIGLPAPP
jgi:hypothetical protein